MNNYYTYVYYDENNIPIYVGKGKGRRAFTHLTRMDKHPFTQKLQKMKSLGTTPTIKFIIKDVDEELALFVEEEFVRKYGRKDLGKGPLLNLTDGGDKAPNTGPDTRKKMSDAWKKRPPIKDSTRIKISNTSRGRSHSEVSKKKMSEWHKGKVVSEETKEKLRQINKGKPQSTEAKLKNKLAHLGVKRSNHEKENIRNAVKNTWANYTPEQRAARIEKSRSAVKARKENGDS